MMLDTLSLEKTPSTELEPSVNDGSRVEKLNGGKRRSQADRSAATRAKVISAARDIPFAQGYSGATMHAIRDAAGISLGAIQHQFPTKAKIMAAVVEEVSSKQAKAYAEAIRRGGTPRESLENLLDVNFDGINRPERAALLEIHLARRNDPDLDREVEPSARRFGRRVRLWTYFILRAAGVNDTRLLVSLQLLNNAMTEGLTVEFIRHQDAAIIKQAIQIWRRQLLALAFDVSAADSLEQAAS